MSLRYKALAVVLILTAAVTGSVLLIVKNEVQSTTVEDIQDDLAKDGQRLKEKIRSNAETARAVLRGTIQPIQLREQRLLPGGLKSNFDVKVGEWVTQSRADFAVAALDSLVAEDCKAQAIHKEKDWWVLACSNGKPRPNRVAEELEAQVEARVASAPALNRLIGRTLTEGRTLVEIVRIGDQLCLAVAVPFFDESTTFQKFCAIEDDCARNPGPASEAALKAFCQNTPASAVAVTLTELNSAWTMRNRLKKPDAGEGNRTSKQKARRENEIHQVLFDGETCTATSLPDAAAAMEALRSARDQKTKEFRVPLGNRGAWVGVALNFDDGQFSWDRPGFLAIKSLEPELGPLHDLLAAVSEFGVLFGVLGAVGAFGAAWMVIRRLRRLQAATEKVRAGDFQVTVRVDSRDEVGVLAVAFNNMIKGLQALGLYTDSILARSVLDNPELLGNKAARHEGSVMFTDIRNFTGITESMDASALTAQLNEYFSAIGVHVKKEGGYLDKFIGDAVMAFWGAPFLTTQDHAARACRAAMHCMRAASELRRHWEKEGKPLFFQRIGVATGEVVVGNIGSATKKNFTVIGDSVNLANRLEGASKVYGTEILLDQRTAELAGNAILVREVDEIVVRGKQQPVRVFELVGLASETSTKAKRIIEGYGAALKQYRSGDYEGAKTSLVELRKTDPEDGPSKWLLGRCDEAVAGKSVPTPLQITKSYGPLKP